MARSRTHLEGTRPRAHLEICETEDSLESSENEVIWKVARSRTHLEGSEAEDSPRNLRD